MMEEVLDLTSKCHSEIKNVHLRFNLFLFSPELIFFSKNKKTNSTNQFSSKVVLKQSESFVKGYESSKFDHLTVLNRFLKNTDKIKRIMHKTDFFSLRMAQLNLLDGPPKPKKNRKSQKLFLQVLFFSFFFIFFSNFD